MIFKAPQMGVGSRVRFTFLDPETGERIPAVNVETGEEVWGGQWFNNMITDAGLDEMATGASIYTREYGQRLTVSGSMSEVKEPSGAVTASQSGTTVTASAAFFSGADVGRAIVWADGSNARIVNYVSPTVVEVDKTQAVTAQAFERWHVDISSLPGVLQSTTTGGSSVASNSWAVDGDYFVKTTSYWNQLVLESNFNVSGFGIGGTSGSDARIVELIRDGSGNPIVASVLAGKAIRVDVQIIARAPRTAKHVALQVDEYDAANVLIGTQSIDADYWFMADPASLVVNGTVDRVFRGLDPHAAATGGLHSLYESGAAKLTPGGYANLFANTDYFASAIGNTAHMGAYVPGSRRRTKEATMTANNGNAAMRGLLLQDPPGHNFARSLGVVLFRDGATFTKASTHTLRAGAEISWDRDYTV